MDVYFKRGIWISILSHIQEMNLKDEASLQTGDILLFRGTSWVSWLVEWFGVSRYSHVGMVIKNPQFMNLDLEDGTYILESSWNNTPDVEDHQMKMGVQLPPGAPFLNIFINLYIFICSNFSKKEVDSLKICGKIKK